MTIAQDGVERVQLKGNMTSFVRFSSAAKPAAVATVYLQCSSLRFNTSSKLQAILSEFDNNL
jgi:hypothetical protein